ncbi:MAG: hypothetical protein ABI443_09655 [Chthoniobacterales bacterium]
MKPSFKIVVTLLRFFHSTVVYVVLGVLTILFGLIPFVVGTLLFLLPLRIPKIVLTILGAACGLSVVYYMPWLPLGILSVARAPYWFVISFNSVLFILFIHTGYDWCREYRLWLASRKHPR